MLKDINRRHDPEGRFVTPIAHMLLGEGSVAGSPLTFLPVGLAFSWGRLERMHAYPKCRQPGMQGILDYNDHIS
jgi:hypothetical protein